MSAVVDKNLYILPKDTPVVQLDCATAFNNLTDKEKRYAHHLATASAVGQLIVFAQVSPEAPIVFVALHQLFKHETVQQVKDRALAAGWTEDDFSALLVYAAGFYGNGGNYKGFGDTKIVPEVDQAKLTALLKASVAFQKAPKLAAAWDAAVGSIYSLEPGVLTLGFGNEGVTTYHTRNITKKDTELVDRFMASKHLEAWNTRLLKEEGADGKATFTIRLAAPPQVAAKTEEHKFEDATIRIVRDDYGRLLSLVSAELEKAALDAANENQSKMLHHYSASFKTGELAEHKEGSRWWIRDLNPAIESYIGFIENYRDPAGTRSEFEGFVAAVNKLTSAKFKTLVDRAEEILVRLPWGKAYEKDRFLKPDFTALDVIYFGSSGIPSGINIPNYDDIRQDIGFKNVSLGNVISAMPKQKIEFLSAEDEALFIKHFKDSFEVQVGLHELLGHGSGKLFIADGAEYNFDKDNVKDLVTGGPVTSWYKKGETWGSKFGAFSGPYEECRAEAVGYFLCCYDDIMKIFGYEGALAEEVRYVNWLSEIRSGLTGLEFYQPEAKKWGQAHCFARYVLLKVALAAGEGFVTIEEVTAADGKPDLRYRLDRTKIQSVGKPAIEAFLKLLQAYKSTGDAEGGIKLFTETGAVGPTELRWREVVVARRKPRRVFVQSVSRLDGKGGVALRSYPETAAGVVESFVDRHTEESVAALLDYFLQYSEAYGITVKGN